MSRRRAWVIGHPIAHSLSPALHNPAFAELGIEAVYEARDVPPDALEAAVAEMRGPDFLGANVTAPDKQAIVRWLDDLAGDARALGAVNTVVPSGGRLIGDNPDAAGLAAWLEEAEVPVDGVDALVLGAGGAARATVVALARGGARSIVVLNRTLERATVLVTDLAGLAEGTSLRAGSLDEAAGRAPHSVKLLINATSLGHLGAAPAVDPSWYAPGAVAVDLAYNPPVSPFMSNARLAGVRAENGLGMLVHQAALALSRWTGRAVPVDAYWRAARQALDRASEPVVAEAAR